jgi:putative transcriptional regulator
LHAYIGHAGWAPGQLDLEIAGGSWVLCSADGTLLFETNPDEMWEHVLRSMGPSYERLLRVPVDPRVN